MKKIVIDLFLQYGNKYSFEEIKEITEKQQFETLYDAIQYFEGMEE